MSPDRALLHALADILDIEDEDDRIDTLAEASDLLLVVRTLAAGGDATANDIAISSGLEQRDVDRVLAYLEDVGAATFFWPVWTLRPRKKPAAPTYAPEPEPSPAEPIPGSTLEAVHPNVLEVRPGDVLCLPGVDPDGSHHAALRKILGDFHTVWFQPGIQPCILRKAR